MVNEFTENIEAPFQSMIDAMIYSQSLENFIIDLISYSFIILILFSLYFFRYIDKRLLIFFLLYSSTPFLVNDLIISSTEMWDQYTNLLYVIDFRQHVFKEDYFYYYLINPNHINTKFIVLSHIYGIIPLFMNSINSIAFANKLLLALTSIYLLHKGYIKKAHLFFLLLLPSTLIYSSLSLKEVLICVSCIWILIFLVEKKYLYLIITFVSFFLVRPEFYSLIGIFVIYYLFMKKFFNNKNIIILFHLIIVAFLLLNSMELINMLNKYIIIYNQEDAGWGGVLNPNTVNLTNINLNSLVQSFKTIFNKLILNWPVSGTYKFLFLFENILVISFIVKNFSSDMKKKIYQTCISKIFLFISIFILYLMIPNIIALHRFFYPFLFFYILMNNFKFDNENNSYNN